MLRDLPSAYCCRHRICTSLQYNERGPRQTTWVLVCAAHAERQPHFYRVVLWGTPFNGILNDTDTAARYMFSSSTLTAASANQERTLPTCSTLTFFNSISLGSPLLSQLHKVSAFRTSTSFLRNGRVLERSFPRPKAQSTEAQPRRRYTPFEVSLQ